MSKAEFCRDCSRSYRANDPVFDWLWQLNCPYRYNVTYAVARSVTTGELCQHWKPREGE